MTKSVSTPRSFRYGGTPLLKYAAQKNGWVFERLADLARVLRVPGTQNIKDAANPKEVIIRKITDQRYNPSEFRSFLDDLAIPDDDDNASKGKEWRERFVDKTLIIDLAATVAEEHLARWIEQDNFRDTWNHQRTDMTDPSPSAYDLALMNFGVRNGLDDQRSSI